MDTNEDFWYLLMLEIDTMTNDFVIWCPKQTQKGGARKVAFEMVYQVEKDITSKIYTQGYTFPSISSLFR